MKNKTKNKLLVVVIVCCLPVLLVLLPCYLVVTFSTKGRIYDSLDQVPYNEVGMVLGTGPTTASGKRNVFFDYRVDAVEELYKAGKIRFILISGDNSRKDYSEPDVMRDSLVRRGVPQEVIYLDYAGFRTWDSVVRAKKVFGQNRMTVISQRFHNERSIFIGNHFDMDLVGYNAKDVAFRWRRVRVYVREAFARVKIFIDFLTDKQPHFLGEKIEIAQGKPQEQTNSEL